MTTDVGTNTIGVIALLGDGDGARIEPIEQGLGAHTVEPREARHQAMRQAIWTGENAEDLLEDRH